MVGLLFASVPFSVFSGNEIISLTEAPRRYYYEKFHTTITIKTDTTFDVEERQTFNYTGTYHQGWRNIFLNLVDAITDIQVIDGNSGARLRRVFSRQDKHDSSSWGTYTYYQRGGSMNIEWYYDLSDTSHEWIIRYTVHGGLELAGEFDQLYWNIFSGFDAPINALKAEILLPKNYSEDELEFTSYRSNQEGAVHAYYRDGKITYDAFGLSPSEAFTVDVGFPKGAVNRNAYWIDFFKLYWPYIASGILLIATVFTSIFLWYFTEKYKKGRGTIIPHYEPPENLRPAMAEVVVKETVTPLGLAATIVDLAVRGYIEVKEDDNSFLTRLSLSLKALFGGIAFAGAIAALYFDLLWFFIFGGAWATLVVISVYAFTKPDYILIRKKTAPQDDHVLETYEQQFLEILFSRSNRFSTRALKLAGKLEKQRFCEQIKKLRHLLYEETETDTGAFAVGVSGEKVRNIFLVVLFMVIISTPNFSSWFSFFIDLKFIVFPATLVVSVLWIWFQIKYEARLSHKGAILKEDWLGFKLYLETAERYRMQNLTPEFFEKYLPYAIIFRVEKKWGKAFAAMHLPPPQWYVSSEPDGFSGSSFGSSGGFSASSFSSSFSSSFVSAFAGSGAGGGGVGGGSAGGGGGGGGGGAS